MSKPWEDFAPAAESKPWEDFKGAAVAIEEPPQPLDLSHLKAELVNQPSMMSSGLGNTVPPAENPDWAMSRAVAEDPRQIPGAIKDAALLPFAVAGRMVNAGVQDAMTMATGHPEYGGNVLEFFNRTSPDEAAQPLPYEQTLRGVAREHPVVATAGKVAAGLTETAPMMAAGMPAGLLGRLVSIGFSADMLHAGGEAATLLGEEMGKPPEERDPDKITSATASLIQSGAFAPLAGAHGLKPSARAEVMGKLATALINEPMTFPAERAPTEIRSEDFQRHRPGVTAENAPPWEEFQRAPVQTPGPVAAVYDRPSPGADTVPLQPSEPTPLVSNVDPSQPVAERPAPTAPAASVQNSELPPATTAIDPAYIPTVEFPVAKLQLSKDVPNFKGGASEDTGTVAGNELAGKYERTGTAPIVAWERLNGDVEVITGRHRFDLAKRTGEKTIPTQILREADGFTKAQALTFDAEANIRDGQGEVSDYATYFKGTFISEAEARARGLLSRAKGKAGWSLAKSATDDLYALWRNGKVSDPQAVAIANAAPGNSAAQQIGSKFALQGKPPEFLTNVIKASQAEAGQRATSLDLFGNDDSAMQQMAAQAERASKIQNDIAEQIRAVQGAVKRPEVARQMGVDVKDPQAVAAKVGELKAELARWENWPMQADLVAKVRGEERGSVAPSNEPQQAPKAIGDELDRINREGKEAEARIAKLFDGKRRELPPDLAARLLKLSREQQTDAYGPQNESLRMDIIEALTGIRPPKSRAGAKRVGEMLAKYFGIETDKLSVAEVEEAVRAKLKELAPAPVAKEQAAPKPKSDELFAAAETPFNLAGEQQKFVEPTATQTGFGEETLTQNDLFAIADVTKEVDPFKSANAAEKMYGGPVEAAKRIQNQLRVMDLDPAVRKAFTKEQRQRLADVLSVLNENAGKSSASGGAVGSPPQVGPGGELGNDRPNAPTPPPAEDRSFSAFAAAPMEMPEAVRVIKALTGVYPRIRERLGKFAGVFRFTQGEGGKGVVEILASQFDLLTPDEKARLRQDASDYAKATAEPGDNAAKIAEERYQYLLEQAYQEAKTRNPIGAMKTIWHEIGHVVDWLPDHIIRGRGNLFGRIASLKDFLKHTLPFDPSKPAGEKITPADKAKLLAEAERALREEMGPISETIRKIIVEEPEWKVTGITPEDIQNILRENAGKDTPELTRWFAEQDSKVKAEILRKAMRGLVDERLAALGKKVQTGTRTTERIVREKVGRDPTPQEIRQRFAELLAKEIKARNLADLATVKGELQKLIAWWRGTAEIPDYFKSAHEMYADAFSVWANNPAAAALRAPTYSELMWNYLERKPEVKAIYDEIQRQIKSGEIMGQRVRSLHEMWDNDDARSLTVGKENRQTSRRDFYDNIVYHFDRRFGPIYKSAQGYAREGVVKEAIGTYLYKATEHERYLSAINGRVGKWLVEHGLDWNHDLGEYLYHKRVIEERSNIANPLGFTPKNSLERLAEMQANLGADRWHALEIAAKEYRAIYEQHVVNEVTGSRMFTPELNKILTDRTHYATFAAVRNVADNGIQRILDTQYGTSVTPHIYKQIGNLGEIKNPATATVLKGLSLISASYRNTMKREIVAMLQAQDGGNIVPARQRWNGKARENVIVDNHPDVGTIVYLEDGVAKAFYVRRVVSDAVNAGSPTENLILNGMIKVNGWMKGLFTQLNYAFWPVNMVRDTAGTMMQLPGVVVPTYLKNLPRALKAARDSVTHAKPNLDADEALRRKLVISQGDPRGVWAAADNEFELKVASFGMDPAQWSAQAGKVSGLVKAWNYYRELGQTIERVNKISGMLYLDEKFPTMPEWKKREVIRERSGSPNFLERGASNPVVDMLFLFYNPWKEGVRSVAKAARENPWSFGAKATVAVLMPTVLQSAAVNGYLGDERKKQYASIPDYDLTNYLCVPLGWVGDPKNGKISYLRLPLWEPARIAHGTLFQALTKRGAGIMSNAGGQLPGLNPIWQTALAWSEYAMGKNPVDLSRGVNIMPKTTFEAGGTAALGEVAKYSWNNLGGSILHRFKNLNLESAPETTSEKFMALPVVNNALGRWIKISDRGLADADRATTGPIEQKRAQLRLAVRPIAEKFLTHQTLTPSERMVMREPYAQSYLQEILPDLAKSRTSQQYRRLHNAPDAESKAAIAREMRK